MSWCSEWMRDWLGRGGRTQIQLARLCGVAPANVSRWLNDQSKPDRDVMSALVSELDQGEAADLLTAWLRDLMPDGGDRLVRIDSIGGKSSQKEDAQTKGDAASAFPSGMSRELCERLVFFGQLAVANPDLRKILDVCYQAAKRSHPPE